MPAMLVSPLAQSHQSFTSISSRSPMISSWLMLLRSCTRCLNSNKCEPFTASLNWWGWQRRRICGDEKKEEEEKKKGQLAVQSRMHHWKWGTLRAATGSYLKVFSWWERKEGQLPLFLTPGLTQVRVPNENTGLHPRVQMESDVLCLAVAEVYSKTGTNINCD